MAERAAIALLIAPGLRLNRWTHGFEVWTFEGRCELRWRAGELRAQPVICVTRTRAPRLWVSKRARAPPTWSTSSTRAAPACAAARSAASSRAAAGTSWPRRRQARRCAWCRSPSTWRATTPARWRASPPELKCRRGLWTLAVRSAADAQSTAAFAGRDRGARWRRRLRAQRATSTCLDARRLPAIFTLDQAEQALQATRRLAGWGRRDEAARRDKRARAAAPCCCFSRPCATRSKAVRLRTCCPLLAAAAGGGGHTVHSVALSARALAARATSLDWRGWTSAAVASSVALVWMLPSALDAALL